MVEYDAHVCEGKQVILSLFDLTDFFSVSLYICATYSEQPSDEQNHKHDGVAARSCP